MEYEKSKFAPIVLIAYNRLEHFKSTLSSLIKNPEAKETKIYIFIDGPRTSDDEKVQNLIASHARCNEKYFYALNIHQLKKNIGLRRNITQAITSIIAKSNEVIVVEDDVMVSSGFLSFMNKALKIYKNNSRVWHINGFSFLNNPKKSKNIYMTRFMNCYGWGTWKNRWDHYERDVDKLFKESSFMDRAYLSLFGLSNHWRQVQSNKSGEIDTWAVFWHATIARNKGMCVTPWLSYTKNIGFDGSGTNCPEEKHYQKKVINNCKNPNLIFYKGESKYALMLLSKIFIQNIFKALKRRIFT